VHLNIVEIRKPEIDAKLMLALKHCRGEASTLPGAEGNWTEYMKAFSGRLYRPDVAPAMRFQNALVRASAIVSSLRRRLALRRFPSSPRDWLGCPAPHPPRGLRTPEILTPALVSPARPPSSYPVRDINRDAPQARALHVRFPTLACRSVC
jgi:hypothetical protein